MLVVFDVGGFLDLDSREKDQEQPSPERASSSTIRHTWSVCTRSTEWRPWACMACRPSTGVAITPSEGLRTALRPDGAQPSIATARRRQADTSDERLTS